MRNPFARRRDGIAPVLVYGPKDALAGIESRAGNGLAAVKVAAELAREEQPDLADTAGTYGGYGPWSFSELPSISLTETPATAQDRLRTEAAKLEADSGQLIDWKSDDVSDEETVTADQLRLVADLLDVPTWGIPA